MGSQGVVCSEAVGEVELDILSGQVNPHWGLDSMAARDLSDLLSALGAGQPRPEPARLGYRGFTVTLAAPAERRIRAVDGSVTVEQGEARLVYRDPDRQVERWLLGTGEGHLAPNVLQHVRELLSAPSA